ncbi:MAG: ActR/PrrA/RegA family redox response regulator transcription factor [Pseudomonadota bacterium]
MDDLNQLHRPTEAPSTPVGIDPRQVAGSADLLLLDDDGPLRRSLSRALERRGFAVHAAGSLAEGREFLAAKRFAFAVLDMRLEDGHAMSFISELQERSPGVRVAIVTGYGNIASAVAAVKQGAVDYLAKPVDGDEIADALLHTREGLPPPPEAPMSPDRVRWEHIQRVFEQCGRNVSETARRLNMHRRTLQRILNKRAPRE